MTTRPAGSRFLDCVGSAWLTPRRIRAQAIVLALCLWGVCAVDYATPGIFDRAGNIKFQDFIQFPISARLIAQGRASRTLRRSGPGRRPARDRWPRHHGAPAIFLRTASCPAVYSAGPILLPRQAANLGHALAADVFRLRLSALEIVPRSSPVSACSSSSARSPIRRCFTSSCVARSPLWCWYASPRHVWLSSPAVTGSRASLSASSCSSRSFLSPSRCCCSWRRRGNFLRAWRRPRPHSWLSRSSISVPR